MSNTFKNYILQPKEELEGLTQLVNGFDQNGQACEINVVEEQPLTIFLNGQEIVTAMTIGDYPQYLALGFLKNQRMLNVLKMMQNHSEIITLYRSVGRCAFCSLP